MIVEAIAPHGFCQGVVQAVRRAEEALAEGPLFCLHPPIHNENVCEALAAKGVAIDWIYHSRKPDAARFGGNVALHQMPEIAACLAKADIALSAVDSSRPVVTPEMRDAVADRNVLFIDLGVPRNIDPFYDDFGHGVTVADLDDLKLWHRVKTGTLNEVLAKADEVIRAEYRAML